MRDQLLEKIQAGDHRAIAKGITLLESRRKEDRQAAVDLLSKLQMHEQKASIRIGISGIPGVGKSTFINALGSFALKLNPQSKIAILTIDPSSPMEGGSILADRLRMTELSHHPHVFIRPSPTSGIHGGLSRRTRESIFLLEAAGFDILFVETVGVGQTEFHVASLVDIFLLLQMPSTGDEWQAMKKGILELADMIIVNKSDGDLQTEAKKLQKILELSLYSEDKDKVYLCSSLLNKGFPEIWRGIESKISDSKAQNSFFEKRRTQNLFWFEEELLAQIQEELHSNLKIAQTLDAFRKELSERNFLFSALAEKALKSLFPSK